MIEKCTKWLLRPLIQAATRENFCNIHRKTPVLESLFIKVASLQPCDFIKKRLQHRCFPVKFAKFLTPILKNICEWLRLP